MTHLYATFLLYLFIYIEQTIDQDFFSQEEEESIGNVSLFAFLAMKSFKETGFNKEGYIEYIRNNYPKSLQKMTEQTAEDLQKINSSDHLEKEMPYYKIIGEILFNELDSFLDLENISEEDHTKLFSWAMFSYDSLILLEHCDYDIEDSESSLSEWENSEMLAYILSETKKRL